MKFKDIRVGMLVEDTSDLLKSRKLPQVGVVEGFAFRYDTEILLCSSNPSSDAFDILPVVKFIGESESRKVLIDHLKIYEGRNK
jgi:hypothetical protein